MLRSEAASAYFGMAWETRPAEDTWAATQRITSRGKFHVQDCKSRPRGAAVRKSPQITSPDVRQDRDIYVVFWL